MYWSSVIHRIFILFLFALSQKLTLATSNNVTQQRSFAATAFTKFLTVPWSNWNTPWIHEVQSACASDIAALAKNALAGETWALQMLDASSKIPAGILTGNIRDLGMYEECVEVRPDGNSANIQGRHCMVSMAMPTEYVEDPASTLYLQKLSAYNPTPNSEFNFAASLCLPSSCGVEDITEFVNASIRDAPELFDFQVRVAEVTCSKVESEVEVYTLGTILTLSFFMVLIGFMVLCTVCDFFVKTFSKNTSSPLQTLAKFSLYTNAIKLASTEIAPGTMPAIHGVRFFSMFLVVTVHRVLSVMVKPLVNLSDVYELRHFWMAPLLLILPYAVDTFFILSGFLTAYVLLNALRSGAKINVLQLYMHRYLRLAPCIGVLILFDIFILPHVGSGPIWQIVLGVTSDFCKKNWWTNLLYVQNFVNQEQMCLPHSWYTAVEMQLFWICPIILFPLFYRPKLGLGILTGVTVVALITPAVHLVLNEYSFLFNTNKNFLEKYSEFISSYTLTYNRALPYFVGIGLGYYVVNNKRKLTKVQVALNWILASIFFLFCLWNASFVQPVALTYNPAWEAAYVSVGRLGWSLAVAWIVYACTQGYGGPVGRFLSLPVFVPLSRISYGIYLVSAILQVGVNATEQTAEFGTKLGMLYLVWGDLVISAVIAFILNLFVETPVIVMEKILNGKGSSRIVKSTPIVKDQEKVPATISKQAAEPSNTNCVSSNLEIDTIMSQLHFWESVSDVLNTLSKVTNRTPAEWLQTWQDWKSDLSNDNRERKTKIMIIENGFTDSEARTTTVERELLIFLVAATRGADVRTISEDSKHNTKAIELDVTSTRM